MNTVQASRQPRSKSLRRFRLADSESSGCSSGEELAISARSVSDLAVCYDDLLEDTLREMKERKERLLFRAAQIDFDVSAQIDCMSLLNEHAQELTRHVHSVVQAVPRLGVDSTPAQTKTIASVPTELHHVVQKIRDDLQQVTAEVKDIKDTTEKLDLRVSRSENRIKGMHRRLVGAEKDFKDKKSQLTSDFVDQNSVTSLIDKAVEQQVERRLGSAFSNVTSILMDGHEILDCTMCKEDRENVLRLCVRALLKCGDVFVASIAAEVLEGLKEWGKGECVVVVTRSKDIKVHANAKDESLFVARVGPVNFTIFSPQLQQESLGHIEDDIAADVEASDDIIEKLTEVHEQGVWQAIEGRLDDYALACTHHLFNRSAGDGLVVWNGVGKEKPSRRLGTGFRWCQ